MGAHSGGSNSRTKQIEQIDLLQVQNKKPKKSVWTNTITI